MGIITKEKRNGLYKLNTRILPSFLSPKTIELVEKLRIEADQIVSEGMIEDVRVGRNQPFRVGEKQPISVG